MGQRNIFLEGGGGVEPPDTLSIYQIDHSVIFDDEMVLHIAPGNGISQVVVQVGILGRGGEDDVAGRK